MDPIAAYRAEKAKRGLTVPDLGTVADRDRRIAQAYRSGDTIPLIAAAHGIGVATVHRALKRRGATRTQSRRTTATPLIIQPQGAQQTWKQQLRSARSQVKQWRTKAERLEDEVARLRRRIATASWLSSRSRKGSPTTKPDRSSEP